MKVARVFLVGLAGYTLGGIMGIGVSVVVMFLIAVYKSTSKEGSGI